MKNLNVERKVGKKSKAHLIAKGYPYMKEIDFDEISFLLLPS